MPFFSKDVTFFPMVPYLKSLHMHTYKTVGAWYLIQASNHVVQRGSSSPRSNLTYITLCIASSALNSPPVVQPLWLTSYYNGLIDFGGSGSNVQARCCGGSVTLVQAGGIAEYGNWKLRHEDACVGYVIWSSYLMRSE